MIYFIILLFLVAFAWYWDVRQYEDTTHEQKQRSICYWAVFATFVIISGLRYRIGMDTVMYLRSWDWYGNIWDFQWWRDIEKFRNMSEYVERFQPGWILLCMICRGITSDFTFVQVVVTLVFNIALFRVIKQYGKYPFLTLLMFYVSFKFLEFEFEIMRESLAVGLYLLFAFPAYMKKKWWVYYLVTVGLLLFHTSVLLMLVLPLFRNMNWSFKKYSLLFILPSFLLGLTGRVLLGDLVNAVFSGDDFVSQYTLNAFDQEYNNNYVIMFSFQPILLYVMAYFGMKRIERPEFVPLVFVTIVFFNLSIIYFTASRLVNYIIILVYIALTPQMMQCVRKFRTIWICVLLMIVFMAPTLYSFVKPINVARYYPYHWVFNPKQTSLQKTL